MLEQGFNYTILELGRQFLFSDHDNMYVAFHMSDYLLLGLSSAVFSCPVRTTPINFAPRRIGDYLNAV